MSDVDRTSRLKRHRSGIDWYSYEARIQYMGRDRIIPISESDYERVKPTDSLAILYDASVDDCMAADYPPDYSQVIVTGFFWLITFLVIRPAIARPKKGAV